MKEFRVEIRVKNNLLWQAIDRAGFDSVAAFARHTGVNNTTIGKYINLLEPPMTSAGAWKESADKLAAALQCLPEDLFPADYLREVIKQNKVVREYSADEIQEVMQIAQSTPEALMIQSDAMETLRSALEKIPARRRRALELRYGLDGGEPMTLEETAKAMGVTRERIRQMELSAMRQLKHPSLGLSPALARDFV